MSNQKNSSIQSFISDSELKITKTKLLFTDFSLTFILPFSSTILKLKIIRMMMNENEDEFIAKALLI